MNLAIFNNKPNLVQWLQNIGCEYDSSTLRVAMENKNREVISWTQDDLRWILQCPDPEIRDLCKWISKYFENQRASGDPIRLVNSY